MEIKQNWEPKRYGIIDTFPKREVVLLRGFGCFYSKCYFCDYHLDKSDDGKANFTTNKAVLDNVTGAFNELEVICSGSVQELDDLTIEYIKTICIEKNISKLSLECHYKYIDTLKKLRNYFNPIDVEFRIGIETFDMNFREKVLNKFMPNASPKEIAKHFKYCNLLICISGQTKEQILEDIAIADKYFERVCIGVFEENATHIKKDYELLNWFLKYVKPRLKDNPKFQIIASPNDYPLGDGCMTEGKNE